MKRKLRLGDSYALTKDKLKYLKIQYISLLAVSFIMCAEAQAQRPEPSGSVPLGISVDHIKPLQIGDTIPEYVWQLPLLVVNHPEGKKTIMLGDYRDKKLIILDFWATWCSSCIAAMPKIHQLEKEHVADMVVIPVTGENADKVAPFLAANKTVQQLGLYSVVGNETLRATFPHRIVPHYVWISPAGEVGAVTTSERVNAQNIELFIGGEQAKIPVRKDIDADRPLFLSDVIEINDLTHYSIFTKGKFDGLPSGNRFRKENGVLRGRAMTNLNILSMYQVVANALLEKIGDRFSDKRLVLGVMDTTGLLPQKTALGGYVNLYNYELIVPVESADFLFDYMLQDLNRYTGYHGRVEVQKVKCLILTKTDDLGTIGTKGGKPENTLFFGKPPRLVNYPLSYLVDRLNGRNEIPFTVINETGHTENVDIGLSGKLDLETLKKELREQGLDLVEGYRQLNMFILEDKPISPF